LRSARDTRWKLRLCSIRHMNKPIEKDLRELETRRTLARRRS